MKKIFSIVSVTAFFAIGCSNNNQPVTSEEAKQDSVEQVVVDQVEADQAAQDSMEQVIMEQIETVQAIH